MPENDGFYEDLVSCVLEDFHRRQQERLPLERQWELNLNYIAGNQYCEINPAGEVDEEERYYFWQDRNVYNRIAPLIDTRIAKLTSSRPVMSVRASGGDESDLMTAKLSTAILNSTYNRLELDKIINRATGWSESCGTAFYEVVWDALAGANLGELDGKPVYEGDVKISVISPFEIFPDSLSHEDLCDCKSIIHARAMHVDDVYEKYGIKLVGEDISVFSLLSASGENIGKVDGMRHNNVLVIERFERPNDEYPNGRVICVSGNTLLYIGDLPFINGVEGRRDFPFIKQTSLPRAGSFFGLSTVERVIPVQRAYNAVKNRKQEFLNRISMGVLTVEDGSVDTDDLEENGLSPGKIIVYRQGSSAPSLLNAGSLPAEFTYEEQRLENEFIQISGVSEFSKTSSVDSGVSSGVALQMLIDQDNTRLSNTLDNMRSAIKSVAKHIIRLFRQFATTRRTMRIAGENASVEVFYFDSSTLSSDDVVFDTESQLAYSPAQKKSAIYELISSGLLTDKTGVMSERTKAKVLDLLGFGSVAGALDIEELHRTKAEGENIAGYFSQIPVDEYDDHDIHIAEHTRFLLSGESDSVRTSDIRKQNALSHLRQHKKLAMDIAN